MSGAAEFKFASPLPEPLTLLDDAQQVLLACREGFVIDRCSMRLRAVAQGFVNAGAALLSGETDHELHFSLTEQGRALADLYHDFRSACA
jgi:hypothetical protein